MPYCAWFDFNEEFIERKHWEDRGCKCGTSAISTIAVQTASAYCERPLLSEELALSESPSEDSSSASVSINSVLTGAFRGMRVLRATTTKPGVTVTLKVAEIERSPKFDQISLSPTNLKHLSIFTRLPLLLQSAVSNLNLVADHWSAMRDS